MTRLRRSDFGITWNQTIEGTRVVADDVQIQLSVEAEKLLTPPAISPALMINTLRSVVNDDKRWWKGTAIDPFLVFRP